MSRPFRVLPGLAALLLPMAAVAWTPYGYGPYVPGAELPHPGMGYPGAPDLGEMGHPGGTPFDLDRPPFPYAGRGNAPAPGAWAGPGYGRPPARGLRISRSMSADGYVLDIALGGLRPEDVKVRVLGPWLVVGTGGTAEQHREERYDAGRGYARSYSWSSGGADRRVGLPMDADGSALRREDSAEAIRITIPRRAPQGAKP